MFKFVSVILVFVMVFSLLGCASNPAVGYGLLGLGVIILIGVGMEAVGVVEAESPDDGIRMVSAENEEFEKVEIKTDSKPVLNVLQHVEVGVSQDKDIYVGLRFQY